MQSSRNLKNQDNMTPPKYYNNLPVPDPKHMEVCDLPNEEFKIVILRKLNELQRKQRKTI